MSHHDVVVVGAGLAGLTAAVRLAESGARVLVRREGRRRHASQRRDDRRARIRARPRGAPRRGARRVPRRASRASVRPGRRRRDRRRAGVVQGPRRERLARPVRLHRERGREPPAADRRRRAAAVGGRARDDGARRPARRWAGRRRRLPRAQGLPSGAARRHAHPLGRRDGALEAARGRARGPCRRQRARVRARVRRSRVPRPGRRPARRAGSSAADERVAFPAVLGIADPHGAWTALEHALGRPVFEVPTLPPSVPGMRVFAILREALRRAGGTLLLNNVVVGAESHRFTRARVANARGAARGAARRRLGRARDRRLRGGRSRARLALDRARDGARVARGRCPCAG